MSDVGRWDAIFPHLPAAPGTEELQLRHRELWETARERGDMTEAEEKELNRLFRAIYPHLAGRGKRSRRRSIYPQDEEDLEIEQIDDDPLRDLRREDDALMAERRFHIPRTVQRFGHGLPMVLVGCLAELFFIMASVLHIQTTEAFFLSIGNTVGLSPDWKILNQPYQLFTGQYAPVVAEAVMAGWIVETAFLILTVSYETLHRSLLATSKRRAAWFRTAIYVLVALDGYSDFQYGNIATGFMGQFFFAALMAFAVLFLGTGGYHMIVEGLSEWSNAHE